MVLAAQNEIERLATRIQRAYQLHGERWVALRSTPRVWTAAAMVLWQAHRQHPDTPLDPELFVAAQARRRGQGDPWSDLASPEAGVAYRRRVRRIVRQLGDELRREVRLAERLAESGRPLVQVLRDEDARLSPLGRFIVARRALRDDLAESWEEAALEQHRGCPLYRAASRSLLAADLYPKTKAAEVPAFPIELALAGAGAWN